MTLKVEVAVISHSVILFPHSWHSQMLIHIPVQVCGCGVGVYMMYEHKCTGLGRKQTLWSKVRRLGQLTRMLPGESRTIGTRN